MGYRAVLEMRSYELLEFRRIHVISTAFGWANSFFFSEKLGASSDVMILEFIFFDVRSC